MGVDGLMVGVNGVNGVVENGVDGATVLGVAGFNFPLTEDRSPPVRSAMRRLPS